MQSFVVTDIMTREKYGILAVLRNIPLKPGAITVHWAGPPLGR